MFVQIDLFKHFVWWIKHSTQPVWCSYQTFYPTSVMLRECRGCKYWRHPQPLGSLPLWKTPARLQFNIRLIESAGWSKPSSRRKWRKALYPRGTAYVTTTTRISNSHAYCTIATKVVKIKVYFPNFNPKLRTKIIGKGLKNKKQY